jgi:riboflavin biosynthesis pyrimidine reductase
VRLRELYAVPAGDGPHLRINVVSSIDGAATIGGRSGGLGDAADTATMQALRANADVVLVGAGTVAIEGYGGMRVDDEAAAWRVAEGFAAQPRIAVVSGSASLGPRHPVFAQAVVRPLVVTGTDADADRVAALAEVADIIPAADVADALDQLALAAGRRILCEGGPTLFAALIEADLVDEVCLTLSPRLVGGDAPRVAHSAQEAVRRMSLDDVRRVGDELFLRYTRRRGA